VIEELYDNKNISIPKQDEFHSETKQTERPRRLTTGQHQRQHVLVLYAAGGLLLPDIFHAADGGADAGVDEED